MVPRPAETSNNTDISPRLNSSRADSVTAASRAVASSMSSISEKPIFSPSYLFLGTEAASRPHDSHEWGERVKGAKRASAEPLTRVGGDSPLLRCAPGGEAANLILSAQLTPPPSPKGRSHRLHDVRDVTRIAAGAMSSGLRFRSLISAEWDIAGNCTASVPVELAGRAAQVHGPRLVRHKRDVSSYTLLLQTRCRKCPNCLRMRARRWANRGREEITNSVRTWFATFTLSPSNVYMLRVRAAQRLRTGGVDFHSLPSREKFAELCAEYGAELTKYIKRLRKNTQAPFRYILVAERHKTGIPHFHALFHETDAARPLRHASLAAGYKLGYTKFKLCDDTGTAWYVAKYLAKSCEARIRASLHYGSTSQRQEITALCARGAPRPRQNPATPNPPVMEANKGIENVRPVHSEGQQSSEAETSACLASFEARTLAAFKAAFPSADWQTAALSPARAWPPAARPG